MDLILLAGGIYAIGRYITNTDRALRITTRSSLPEDADTVLNRSMAYGENIYNQDVYGKGVGSYMYDADNATTRVYRDKALARGGRMAINKTRHGLPLDNRKTRHPDAMPDTFSMFDPNEDIAWSLVANDPNKAVMNATFDYTRAGMIPKFEKKEVMSDDMDHAMGEIDPVQFDTYTRASQYTKDALSNDGGVNHFKEVEAGHDPYSYTRVAPRNTDNIYSKTNTDGLHDRMLGVSGTTLGDNTAGLRVTGDAMSEPKRPVVGIYNPLSTAFGALFGRSRESATIQQQVVDKKYLSESSAPLTNGAVSRVQISQGDVGVVHTFNGGRSVEEASSRASIVKKATSAPPSAMRDTYGSIPGARTPMDLVRSGSEQTQPRVNERRNTFAREVQRENASDALSTFGGVPEEANLYNKRIDASVASKKESFVGVYTSRDAPVDGMDKVVSTDVARSLQSSAIGGVMSNTTLREHAATVPRVNMVVPDNAVDTRINHSEYRVRPSIKDSFASLAFAARSYMDSAVVTNMSSSSTRDGVNTRIAKQTTSNKLVDRVGGAGDENMSERQERVDVSKQFKKSTQSDTMRGGSSSQFEDTRAVATGQMNGRNKVPRSVYNRSVEEQNKGAYLPNM